MSLTWVNTLLPESAPSSASLAAMVRLMVSPIEYRNDGGGPASATVGGVFATSIHRAVDTVPPGCPSETVSVTSYEPAATNVWDTSAVVAWAVPSLKSQSYVRLSPGSMSDEL